MISKALSIKTINLLSVVIPVAVAVLLGLPKKLDLGEWTRSLPVLIAIINSTTAVLLIAALVAIKKGNRDAHRKLMTGSMVLGALFLVCYVIYHLTNPSTSFGGEGAIRWFYYFILISHILLSLVVLPLVLRAFFFAVIGSFDRHVKIVKYAYPIWLYVSITGVLAYLLISPYYA